MKIPTHEVGNRATDQTVDPADDAAHEARTIEAIKRYYETHPGGGALHIVLDDGNLEDGNIWWCVANSIPEEKDYDALMIATALLCIDTDRRFDLYEENAWF